MLKNFKKGFGLITGGMLAYATLQFISDKVMRWGAKDESFMEYEKKNNPDLHEKLKKYQPKKEEES